jgi:hypothetical protein
MAKTLSGAQRLKMSEILTGDEQQEAEADARG